MNINYKSAEPETFKDLQCGDVFHTPSEFGSFLMKIHTTNGCNAVCLETGNLWFVDDRDTVISVSHELIIK